MKDKKRLSFDIKLNALNDTDNPTKKEVEFILHDFDTNHNNSMISKETALKALHTLKDMPIVCKYYPVSAAGNDDDALGSHEAYIDEDRETGQPYIALDTVPIGVFTESAYIKTINDNGEEKEVVAGKGVLWASRFPNVIGLLKEWYDRGIPIVSSMEILYDEYHFKDGVEEILNYVYEGHCILNSEDRGEHKKVYPAYDVSKLTRLVAEAMNIMKGSDQNMKFKKVLELSHDDIRYALYRIFDETLEEGQHSWIVDVYDDHFIVEVYGDGEDSFYKYNYTKTENDEVEIDFDSKTEVKLVKSWVETNEVQRMENEINKLKSKIQEFESKLNEKEEELKKANSEKQEIEKKFNETSDKLVKLNSKIEELKEYEKKYKEEQYQKALNEKQELYRAKFAAVNALDKFESEEVQDLIKKAISEDEEGQNALFELNTMIIDLIKIEEENTQTTIRELNSKRENLIDVNDDFDSRYM